MQSPQWLATSLEIHLKDTETRIGDRSVTSRSNYPLDERSHNEAAHIVFDHDMRGQSLNDYHFSGHERTQGSIDLPEAEKETSPQKGLFFSRISRQEILAPSFVSIILMCSNSLFPPLRLSLSGGVPFTRLDEDRDASRKGRITNEIVWQNEKEGTNLETRNLATGARHFCIAKSATIDTAQTLVGNIIFIAPFFYSFRRRIPSPDFLALIN